MTASEPTPAGDPRQPEAFSAPGVIRGARIDDAPIIADFNIRLARETEHRELDPVTVRTGVEAVLVDPRKGTYHLAECDGAIAGQLMITYEWSDWRNGVFWWIQSVYVPHEFRRRGVFRALFGHVRDLADRTAGVCGLRLYMEQENDQAGSTYTALGLRSTGYRVLELDFTARPPAR